MICDICGKQVAYIRKVTEAYGKGKDILLIKDIPIVICPNCGENYFAADLPEVN